MDSPVSIVGLCSWGIAHSLSLMQLIPLPFLVGGPFCLGRDAGLFVCSSIPLLVFLKICKLCAVVHESCFELSQVTKDPFILHSNSLGSKSFTC